MKITLAQLTNLKTSSELAFIENGSKTLQRHGIEPEEFPNGKALLVKMGEIVYYTFETLGVVLIKTPFALHLMSIEQFNELYEDRI